MQHRKKALLLSIIPGLGQFYNKQWIKGLLFLLLGVSFFAVFGDLLNMGLWGLFTLGTEVPRDNSIFLLAEGIIAVIVTCFGLAVYYANLRDAYQNGKRRDEQKELSSLKEQYHNLIGSGISVSHQRAIAVHPGFCRCFSDFVQLCISFYKL